MRPIDDLKYLCKVVMMSICDLLGGKCICKIMKNLENSFDFNERKWYHIQVKNI